MSAGAPAADNVIDVDADDNVAEPTARAFRPPAERKEGADAPAGRPPAGPVNSPPVAAAAAVAVGAGGDCDGGASLPANAASPAAAAVSPPPGASPSDAAAAAAAATAVRPPDPRGPRYSKYEWYSGPQQRKTSVLFPPTLRVPADAVRLEPFEGPPDVPPNGAAAAGAVAAPPPRTRYEWRRPPPPAPDGNVDDAAAPATPLHLYAITYTLPVNEWSARGDWAAEPFALAFRVPLRDTDLTVTAVPTEEVVFTLTPLGCVDVAAPRVAAATEYASRLHALLTLHLDDVRHHPLPAAGYFLLPLDEAGGAVDWAAVTALAEMDLTPPPAGERLRPLTDAEAADAGRGRALECGIVVSSHDNYTSGHYTLHVDGEWDLFTPARYMAPAGTARGASTASYYESRFGLTVPPDRHGVHLVSASRTYPLEVGTNPRQQPFKLIPDACTRVPLPVCAIALVRRLPHLDRFLGVRDLWHRLGAAAAGVPAAAFARAVTPRRKEDDSVDNYERHELLGDAVLKTLCTQRAFEVQVRLLGSALREGGRA